MNVLEQIAELQGQIKDIAETLSHIPEMEEWEAKEYLNVALGYVTDIHRLKLHVAENTNLFNSKTMKPKTSSELFKKHFGDESPAVGMFHPNIERFFEELNVICMAEGPANVCTREMPDDKNETSNKEV